MTVARSAVCLGRIVLSWFVVGAASSVAEPPSAEPITLRVGYSSSVFYDVAVSDARAASRVLGDALMKEAGLEGGSEIVVIENPGQLAAAVTDYDLDILSVLCSEYLTELTDAPLMPVLTAQRGSSHAEQYLLLTRRDRPGNSVADLGGSTLLTAVEWEASVPMMWMEDLLARNGLANNAEFFGLVRTVKSTVKATLPVFFGNAGACLVPKSVYQMVSEMNPQISRSLRVVDTSPGYGYGLVCFSNDLEQTTRKTVMRTLEGLHNSAKGQQLLTLFYVDRLVPFEPAHLESTAELLERHRALAPVRAHGESE